MKLPTLVLMAALAALSQTQPAAADDLFQLSWRGMYYVTNATGQVIGKGFSENNIVQSVAQNTGADPRSLVLVYRPNENDLAVVAKQNGAVTAAGVMQLQDAMDTPSADGSQNTRQAFLNDASHSGAIGSLVGAERLKRDTNGVLTSYSFRGSFQYAFPETNAVFSGNFSTGRRIVDTSGQ